MWFDSHCHLHLCDQAPVEEILESATRAAVDGLVTIGIDAPSSQTSRDLAVRHELWFSAGVHPNQAGEWNEGRGAIEALLDDDRCVAVGETGLDFYRTGAPRDVQEEAFSDHVELAKQHNKALVIHTRESIDAALEVLNKAAPPDRLVFHCWSGTPDQLGRALDTGAFISFAGNVSFPSADDLREAAKVVPADRLLVETDSPYLSPIPRRGRPNEPANVAHVGAAVAGARRESVEDVAAATASNARSLFQV